MAAKSVRGRRDNILKTVGELRDQHETMVEKLKEAEGDLRKVEMLVEKETPSVKSPVVAMGAMAPVHVLAR
jgi:uncharacterized coiled-coil DUF342 family protein